MALSYKNDDQKDERLNPAERLSEQSRDLDQAEKSTNSNVASGRDNVNRDNQPGQDSVNAIHDAEEQASNWKTDVSANNSPGMSLRSRLLSFTTKKKGPFGLIVAAVIASIFGIGALSPFQMPAHMLQNIVGTNDSSAVAMQKRFINIFSHASGDADPTCTSKKIKCRMGRVSNSALRKLEKKGVKACFDGDCTKSNTRRTGYPDKNPSHYEFTDRNGVKTKVEVKDLKTFLSDRKNAKFAAQIFGVRGAFNLRVKAWVGKNIAKRFYNTFGLKRDGGVADGKKNTGKTASERLKAMRTKLTNRIPLLADLQGRAGVATEKLRGKLERAKKGGVVYLGAVAGCISPQIPRYVASGVAAVQLAQLLPVVEQSLLSPAAKMQVSGVDDEYAITPDDAETVGTLLTERTPRNSDNKLSSALDSPYLLAAAGINTGKPPISKEFTPGYSVFINPLVQNAAKAENVTKKQCDVVLHPTTMYAAAGVDAVVTVAASATIIGGIIKVAASFIIGKIIVSLLSSVLEESLQKVIVELVKNDAVPKARGQDFGDVLGIGAAAFFSAGGMARHLPTLTQEEVAEYAKIKSEVELAWADMDRATLSPFDTSSRHTFLGSIAYSFNLALMDQQSLVAKFTALMPNPAQHLVKSTNAQGFTENYCSYGQEFSVTDKFFGKASDEYQDLSEMPTRNMAGLPCTGIIQEQADMDSQQAIDLMVDEGWIDEDIDIADSTTTDELVSSGAIKEETPLADFIEQCSNAASGSYLYDSDACTSRLFKPASPEEACTIGEDGVIGDDGELITCDDDESEDLEGLKNELSPVAITPFLLDYQIISAMNGQDEESALQNTQPSDDENEGTDPPSPTTYDQLPDTVAYEESWGLDDDQEQHHEYECSSRVSSLPVSKSFAPIISSALCGAEGINLASLLSRENTNIFTQIKLHSTPIAIQNSYRIYDPKQILRNTVQPLVV